MPLPKIATPTYELELPSTGQTVQYRPFLVKEEKVLILAAESKDLDEVSNAIANVLSSSVTTPADFDVNSLALFDIEYLFLKARAKSIGETIQLKVTDPDDGYETEHNLNVDAIKVEKNKAHKDIIDIDDKIKIQMKYPGLDFFAEGLKIDNINDSTETVAKCVKQIIVEEEVYSASDLSLQEILEWLDELTSEQYKKVMTFFETMPKLRHVIKLKNPNTGNTFETVLEGLADFF